MGDDAKPCQLSRFIRDRRAPRLEPVAQNLLGWLDRDHSREPADAFPQPAGKDFAGRANPCRALKPGFWCHHSEKEKKPGLVSRRGTLRQWRVARLQTGHRDVTRTFSGTSHSRVCSRHARSAATGKVFSKATCDPCGI